MTKTGPYDALSLNVMMLGLLVASENGEHTNIHTDKIHVL